MTNQTPDPNNSTDQVLKQVLIVIILIAGIGALLWGIIDATQGNVEIPRQEQR